jgi:uncharacterized protein (TIGR02145 family)
MALAMSLAFLACEEKKKPGAEQAEAEAEAPPAEEASEDEGTPHEIQYGEPLTYKGQTYKTVIIGKQTWMAENLNVETANSWCYDNNKSNCAKYGRLYTWNAAMKACPKEWHLPNFQEWDNLMEAAGRTAMLEGDQGHEYVGAGKKLKSKIGWGNNSNGTDNYGFSALPGGFRYPDGSNFGDIGYKGFWWSSYSNGDGGIYRMSMFMHSSDQDDEQASHDNAIGNFSGKEVSFSVRCVKGEAGAEAKAGQPKTEADCPDKKIGEPITAEAEFVDTMCADTECFTTFLLANGEKITFYEGSSRHDLRDATDNKISITYQKMQKWREFLEEGKTYEDGPWVSVYRCDERYVLESVKVLPK